MSFLSCAKIQRLTGTDVASRVLNADTLYIVLQVHFYREVLFGKDLRMCYFTREAKPNPMIRMLMVNNCKIKKNEYKNAKDEHVF